MLLVIGLVVLYWLLGLGTLAIAASLIREPAPLLASLVVIAAWPLVLIVVAAAPTIGWAAEQVRWMTGGSR